MSLEHSGTGRGPECQELFVGIAKRDEREGASHMMLKMQWEDTISGFSFLFLVPLFTGRRCHLPRRAAGAGSAAGGAPRESKGV